LFKLFTTDTENTFKPEDWLAHLQHIIEYEMGDISTKANVAFSDQVQVRMEKIKQLSQALELKCEKVPPVEPSPPVAPPPVQEQRMPAALFGGHFAMAN